MINLYNADCLEKMKEIPAESIDMILCDLPYGVTRCEWDKNIDLKKLWNEYERIISEYLQLKKDGSLATPKPTYKKESIEFQEEKPNEIKNLNEIDEIQLQNALDEIDKLEFSFDSKKSKEEKSEQLKEFWD